MENGAKKRFLDAGLIVNTHGVRGEIKIVPWSDSPGAFMDVSAYYIDGRPVRLSHMRSQGKMILASVEGVDDLNAAIALKNKVLRVDRADLRLEPGAVLVEDIIGMEVFDARLGRAIGRVEDVLSPPANDVYVVREGEHLHFIPAVEAFIMSLDPDAGRMVIRSIEGMLAYEN